MIPVHILVGETLPRDASFPYLRRRKLRPIPGVSLPVEGHQQAYCSWPLFTHSAPGKGYNDLNSESGE